MTESQNIEYDSSGLMLIFHANRRIPEPAGKASRGQPKQPRRGKS